MKKVMILTFVAASAVSALSHAVTEGTVCSAANTAGNSSVTIDADTTGTLFVKAAFTPKCSANVFMAFSQTATAGGVIAGSSKGKFTFGGGSNGGGVRSSASCATSGCVTGIVTATEAVAFANAS